MNARRALWLAACLAAVLCERARSGSPQDAILGTWRGTSDCVDKVRFPACHDEVVVYDVTPSSIKTGAVTLDADKIVEGRRADMGELELTYDAAAAQWVSEFQNARFHGLWTFKVEGDRLTATLVDLPARRQIRAVTTRKQGTK